MSLEESFRDATVMLSMISDNPEDILSVISEIEKQQLLADLEKVISLADTINNEVDFLYFMDNILKIVETSAKLRNLLLPDDFDFTEAQTHRAITLKTHKASEKMEQTQKKVAQIRNSVVTCRENLLRALKK